MWNMNLTNVDKFGDFHVMVFVAVLWQLFMTNHHLRMGNLFLKKEWQDSRVENYSPLVVISHPNQQILRHWHQPLGFWWICNQYLDFIISWLI